MKYSPEDIIQRVRQAGILGAGGAGFPTYFKWLKGAQLLIVNGAECEPLLQSDQRLMENFPDQMVEGLHLAITATRASQGIIAIKDEYALSRAALEAAIPDSGDIMLHLLKDRYPAGDEQLLVFNTVGRIVPEAGLPLDVGCVVNNVNTLRNVFQAVTKRKPVTHRLVTVVGEVYEPKTLPLPIGTSIEDALQLCGGPKTDDIFVFDGGLMMGNPSQGFIRKTTTGLVVLPRSHRQVHELTRDPLKEAFRVGAMCDQCFACTEVCPRYLIGHRFEPHRVMSDIAHRKDLHDPGAVLAMSYLCCHCDLCRVWGCPVELAPGRVMLRVKQWLREAGIENPYHQRPVWVRDFFNGRLPPMSEILKRLNIEPYNTRAPLQQETPEIRRVCIELSQGLGTTPQPIVKQGDRVKQGDLIATIDEQHLGVPLHSSISGTVTRITPDFIEITI